MAFCENFLRLGAGNSKKNAKREAAERLLKFLKTLPPESQRENIGIAEEDELAEVRIGLVWSGLVLGWASWHSVRVGIHRHSFILSDRWYGSDH